MRKPYGKLILVLAAMALVTGGCQKKGNTVETDASTEAVVTESATAREPISEETWSWLVQTYKLLEANCQLLTTEVASLMILVIQSPIQTTRVYRSLSGPNVIPCGMLPEMPGSYPRFRRYRFYGRLQGTLT